MVALVRCFTCYCIAGAQPIRRPPQILQRGGCERGEERLHTAGIFEVCGRCRPEPHQDRNLWPVTLQGLYRLLMYVDWVCKEISQSD